MITAKHWLLIGVYCAALGSASAVQMRTLSISELSQKADLILNGTVTSKTCLRDDAGRIYTKIELKIADTWKGAPDTNLFTIVYGGGTVGDETVEVSGQADFYVGEEVVTFLLLNAKRQGIVIGLSQGKFEVTTDNTSGEKFARNVFHGTPEPSAARTPGAANRRMTLAELKLQTQQASQ